MEDRASAHAGDYGLRVIKDSYPQITQIAQIKNKSVLVGYPTNIPQICVGYLWDKDITSRG